LYAFLSGYSLKGEPGEKFSYSNVGMGLLGHALSRRAAKDYETLVVQRICRPLEMDSTRITLTPELKDRLARGHDKSGLPAPNFEFQALAGAGALRSTTNDLLKYVAAQIGLKHSELTPLMAKTHVIRFHSTAGSDEAWVPGNSGMPWVDNAVEQPPGMQLMGHGGGTAGYSAFVGFDVRQHRGVVVLCNQQGGQLHAGSIGWVLLQQRPLTRETVADVMMHGREVVGIGVALEVDPDKHMPRITRVYPGSPAAEAGLSAGQVVTKIGDVATVSKAVTECASLIRGPDGSKLRLEIVDADGKTSTVELTRHKVKL
jgi:CubicO group peptidase (beta-lactamase class C family)